MFIGSSYNLKIKNTEQPVVVNNTPVLRTDTHKCLGVQIDEKLSWDSHIDMICKKTSAGIGAMRRIKPFVIQFSSVQFIFAISIICIYIYI